MVEIVDFEEGSDSDKECEGGNAKDGNAKDEKDSKSRKPEPTVEYKRTLADLQADPILECKSQWNPEMDRVLLQVQHFIEQPSHASIKFENMPQISLTLFVSQMFHSHARNSTSILIELRTHCKELRASATKSPLWNADAGSWSWTDWSTSVAKNSRLSIVLILMTSTGMWS
mmetsp:Transcript_5260/g.8819  ORF Transcript_5260/g.8819 Transcript_5260/m.8819 type:complete len:172 (-) Transcript_5260:163-678(-)